MVLSNVVAASAQDAESPTPAPSGEAANATPAPPQRFFCNRTSCSLHDDWTNEPYEGQFENFTEKCNDAQLAALDSFGTEALEMCVTSRLLYREWTDCRKQYCQMYADMVQAIALEGGPFFFGGSECRPLLDFNQTLCETSYRDAEAFCDCWCPSLAHFEADDQCKMEVIDFFLLGRRGVELSAKYMISTFCVIKLCEFFEQLGDFTQTLFLFGYGGVPPKCRELNLPFKQSSCNAIMSSNPFEPCPFLEDSGSGNILECTDGHQCEIDIRNADSWSCCQAHNMRKHCPANWPVMCENPFGCDGNADHCCETSVERCASGRQRGCSVMLRLSLPEWVGIVDPGVVIPTEAPLSTTMDPSFAKLASFTTTTGEPLGGLVEDLRPWVMLIAVVVGTACIVCATIMTCCVNYEKVKRQVLGVTKTMSIWANEDAVIKFAPTAKGVQGWEELPSFGPDPKEVARKRQQEMLISDLTSAVRAAYDRAPNHLVVDETSPTPREEAPLRAAIQMVRQAGLEYRSDTSDSIARGEKWLRTLDAEQRLVRCMADVRPDLRTAARVWHAPQLSASVEKPWRATLSGAMAHGQARTAHWANVEKLTTVIKETASNGAAHVLVERAKELRAELVARTSELPADRCVLDPEGEGLRILPVGSKRAVWPITGEIYRYNEDVGVSHDPDDMPPRAELGTCDVDLARPVCASFVATQKCHLGRRCPWRHQMPEPGDSIREPVLLEDA